MSRFGFLFIALLGCTLVQAQEWQASYTLALKAYQQENFSEALEQSKQAVSLCGNDVKGRAYARQLVTASCLALEKYAEGLAGVDYEIEDFSRVEPKGPNQLQAIEKKGQLQMGLGNFEQAAQTFRTLAGLHAQISGKDSYDYFLALADEAGARMKAKQYEEAQKAYESSIAGFRGIPDAGEDYLYALFNSAYIDFTQSHHAPASKKLAELIAFMEQNDLKDYPEYEQSRQMLSKLNVGGKGDAAGLILPADKVKQLFDKAFAMQEHNLPAASALYQECDGLIRENNLLNNTTFSCYINHARLLFAMGLHSESEQMLAKAKDQASQLYDKSGPEQGHVLVLTADLALHAGDVNRAAQMYLEGIGNLKAGDPGTLLKQVRWITEQLIAAKAGAEALPVLAAVLQDNAYNGLPVGGKITLHQLNGNAHLEARQEDKLISWLTPRLQSEKNAEIKQCFYLLLAQATLEKGKLQDAHQQILKGLAIAPEGMTAGELYFESARAYQESGDYKAAEINYRKALESIGKSPMSESVIPRLFNSLATFYIQLGNYGAAEKFFLNLLAHEGGSPGFFNAVRQNLAALYQQTGRYAEAKKLMIKTLKADALQGTDHPDYAISLQNLAGVYQNLRQLDSAQLLYEQALEIDRRQLGENSLSFATKLANLGTVLQEAGNFQGARDLFEKALTIRTKLLSAEHPDLAYSQFTLANLLYRIQKPREALPLFTAAADYYIRQIHDVFPVLSDHERTAFYNRVQEVITTYETFILENIDLNASMPAALLDFRLQTKALLLNSSLKTRNQILTSGDPALISDFHVWQHTKEQLAYLYTLTKAERMQHAALIEEFAEQATALEKSLSLKSASFASAFVSPKRNWTEVQSSLKGGEAAVEILRAKLKTRDSVLYAALIVKPGIAKPEVVLMADGNFLEARGFVGYTNRMRYKLEDRLSYDLYWKKLEPALEGIHTLYLSPDGVYTKVNPVTLFDPVQNVYLIDRMRVSLVSNLHDLVGRRESAAAKGHALLVGHPNYRLSGTTKLNEVKGTDRSASLFTSEFQNGFSDLPATEKEVTEIQQMLQKLDWKVDALLREKAGEDRIKESISATLLHIATHGFFIAPKDEHASQVYSMDIRDIESSTMLRSGLLLAGAETNLVEMLSGQPKSQTEDGILTAYEVMNLRLDNTDLVVLSACETGAGDLRNGEGVYGLQRAFLLAGAKHVMMSLWKVDDAATQELMAEFYAGWLAGNDKITAFHEAQREMKKRYAHPLFWGAFVMMGR